MTTLPQPLPRVLETAASAVGLSVAGARPIRLGENALILLPKVGVARIARPGQEHAAHREVAVARWLTTCGVPVVRPLDVDQPVMAEGRAVTFWAELGEHTRGTVTDVAHLLTQLHTLDPPTTLDLGHLDPFVRLRERIDDAHTLDEADREWLTGHLRDLRAAWERLPAGRPWSVVHGDAWVGNVARLTDGSVVLLDLERCSVGPPEWDLVSTAIKATSFPWVDPDDYADFVRTYGYDVHDWEGFTLMRDIRELRMTLYFAQHAPADPAMHVEAQFRLQCLRGDRGSRPWAWTPAT
ncbi:aminoglycoside phosphotransferase family protein [Nocardiopsis sp. NPDC049922]|uniref:phosphotransferase family protein n=1 Tax=Nocardiopsis sp. NPDC049922 TaxID=3155157 RepID=UPI0033D1A43F